MPRVIVTLLAAAMFFPVLAQEIGVVSVTPPSLLKANRPSWPGAADREALVILEFTINPDGTPSDITVADGGFHEKRFVDASIRLLTSARFRPRTVNGVPVVSYGVRLPVKFAITAQQQGVTREFMREVDKVSKLIDDGDYAGAHFHAQWMLSEKVKLQFEYVVLQATLANTLARAGETHAALTAARNATARTSTEVVQFTPGAPISGNSASNYMLNKELLVPMLELRFKLAASLGFSVDALKTYAELAGLRDIPQTDLVAVVAGKLTQLVLSDQPLVANAKLDELGHGTHEIYRRTFTVRDVKDGSLRRIGLGCQGKTRDLVFRPEVEWSLPESWNACTLSLEGEPGTIFQIVEFASRQEDTQQTSLP